MKNDIFCELLTILQIEMHSTYIEKEILININSNLYIGF